MGIVTYTLICYALTAVISYAVVGIIIMINKTMSGKNNGQEG